MQLAPVPQHQAKGTQTEHRDARHFKVETLDNDPRQHRASVVHAADAGGTLRQREPGTDGGTGDNGCQIRTNQQRQTQGQQAGKQGAEHISPADSGHQYKGERQPGQGGKRQELIARHNGRQHQHHRDHEHGNGESNRMANAHRRVQANGDFAKRSGARLGNFLNTFADRINPFHQHFRHSRNNGHHRRHGNRGL